MLSRLLKIKPSAIRFSESKKRSFTLVELLVIIAVVGLLAALAIVALFNALATSRDTRRMGDFRIFPNALELYFQDNGKYPIWTTGGCTSDGQSNPLISALVPTYMLTLPKDPLLTQYCLYYQSDSTGLNYKLAAKMERNTTKAAGDGGTASNYYEAYNTSGSTISLTNSDLDKVMTNQQIYGEASIVAEWKMDEDSWNNNCSASTVLDTSAYANHGKSCPAGTGPLGGETSCMNGKCGLFDGGNDNLDCGVGTSLDITQVITIGMWIKWPSAAVKEIIAKMNNSNSSPGSYEFYQNSNKVVFRTISASGGSKDLTSATTIGNDTWTHIVATWDGVTKKIFINGTQDVNTQTQSAPIYSTTGKLVIGAYANGSYPFAGTIDEVRIYGRDLTACEVCEQCRRFQSKASCNNCTNCSGN